MKKGISTILFALSAWFIGSFIFQCVALEISDDRIHAILRMEHLQVEVEALQGTKTGKCRVSIRIN